MGKLGNLLIRTTFYPSLLINRIACTLGIWQEWNTVEPYLLIGSLPTRADLRVLHDQGVRAVVNLCDEFAGHTHALANLRMEQLRLPTVDYHSPSLSDIDRGVQFIGDCVSGERAVYVHCKAGRGRSATLVLCYLIASRGLDGHEAEQVLRRVRPQVDRRLAARPVVSQFANRRKA